MGLVLADFKDRTYRRRVDRRPRRRRLLLKLLGQPLANRDRRRTAICLKARLAHTRAIHLDLQPQRRAHRRAARFGSEYRRARGETTGMARLPKALPDPRGVRMDVLFRAGHASLHRGQRSRRNSTPTPDLVTAPSNSAT